MDERTLLRGACSCGRNHYFIQVPSNTLENLQVLYDDRAEHSMLPLIVSAHCTYMKQKPFPFEFHYFKSIVPPTPSFQMKLLAPSDVYSLHITHHIPSGIFVVFAVPQSAIGVKRPRKKLNGFI